MYTNVYVLLDIFEAIAAYIAKVANQLHLAVMLVQGLSGLATRGLQ